MPASSLRNPLVRTLCVAMSRSGLSCDPADHTSQHRMWKHRRPEVPLYPFHTDAVVAGIPKYTAKTAKEPYWLQSKRIPSVTFSKWRTTESCSLNCVWRGITLGGDKPWFLTLVFLILQMQYRQMPFCSLRKSKQQQDRKASINVTIWSWFRSYSANQVKKLNTAFWETIILAVPVSKHQQWHQNSRGA